MIIQFNNLIENTILENDSELRTLQNLRDLLRSFIERENFRVECINTLLDSIEFSLCANEEWSEPTFFYNKNLKYSARMIFWPSFYENNPHQHKTWSVTGVMHNQLNIKTYELFATKQLKRLKSIMADKFEVGFLQAGCIHNVSNPTAKLSASFHIFNNIDVLNTEENAVWYPAPRRFRMSSGATERALSICIEMLKDICSEQSFLTIQRIYCLASPEIKLHTIPVLYKFNRQFAKEKFEELSHNF